MPLEKKYSKSKDKCKVTFKCPTTDEKQIFLVGDFNQWDKNATPMKKSRQGFSATLELDAGREYQFRYFLSGEKWANDDAADGYADTPFSDAQNSVCIA